MIGDVNGFLNDPEDVSRVELDVMIAEENFRGKGRGKEAVLLMMWYCVRNLQILKFYCKIHEGNKSSLSLFQRHASYNFCFHLSQARFY
jgi:RimJ/RimL family protein N-acetyltransferase